jgi:hypothetical protein
MKAAHVSVRKYLCKEQFISKHGLYFVLPSWLQGWINRADEKGVKDMESLAVLG